VSWFQGRKYTSPVIWMVPRHSLLKSWIPEIDVFSCKRVYCEAKYIVTTAATRIMRMTIVIKPFFIFERKGEKNKKVA